MHASSPTDFSQGKARMIPIRLTFRMLRRPYAHDDALKHARHAPPKYATRKSFLPLLGRSCNEPKSLTTRERAALARVAHALCRCPSSACTLGLRALPRPIVSSQPQKSAMVDGLGLDGGSKHADVSHALQLHARDLGAHDRKPRGSPRGGTYLH